MKKSTSTQQVAFENYHRAKQPARSSERTFGLFFGTLFLLIGVIKPAYFIWFFLAAFMYLGAMLFPKVLIPFNKLWMLIGKILHTVMNPLIMGVLFFGILTPLSFVTKILGRDPLRLKYVSTGKTYWVLRDPADQTDLKNQF